MPLGSPHLHRMEATNEDPLFQGHVGQCSDISVFALSLSKTGLFEN